LLTTLGLVELREQVWRQGRGKTWRALSRALRVNPRGESPRLARALVDFGADHAFAPAAAKVQEHYGVEVSASRVSRVCYRTAAKIAAPHAGGVLPTQGPDWIVAQTDGTMIPMVTTSGAPAGADRRKHRKICWQEMRLAAARPLGSATTTYACSRGDVVAAGTAWAQAVNDSGRALSTRIHTVGDGAPWIEAQSRVQFGHSGRYLLDLYHVCDYLAAAAPDTAAPGPYLTLSKTRLCAGAAKEVIAELAARREPPELPDQAAPVRVAHRYLSNRLDQLDYPAALAAGLPIGSGLIEGSHRFVLQARLKKPGAWWDPSHADAIANLRVLRANGQWLTLWRN
jgi:hypothetical protein